MRVWTEDILESVHKNLDNLFENERYIVLVRDTNHGCHLLSNSPTDVVIEVLRGIADSLENAQK